MMSSLGLSLWDHSEKDQSGLDQSALAPENFTTLAHFSVSVATRAPNSPGVPPMIVPPMSVKRLRTLGSLSALLISRFNRSTIVAGVSLGTPMPYQTLVSSPGRTLRWPAHPAMRHCAWPW